MSNLKKIKIYQLAKELKQDVKNVVEELRREGADISVPSNSVSAELAEKIRNRYFPKKEAGLYPGIKIIKKDTKNVITPYSKKLTDISQKQKKHNVCAYCSKVISSKRPVKLYKEHILKECSQKPVFSRKNVIKCFDLMTEKTNAVNKKRLSSIELALYLTDSELSILQSNIPYSPFHYHIGEDPTLILTRSKKKLKIVIFNELFNLYYPYRIKFDSISDFIESGSAKIRTPYDEVQKWLKNVANFYIKAKKKENVHNTVSQASKNEVNLSKVEYVEWEIFPAGNWLNIEESTAELFAHFQSLQNKEKYQNKSFDRSRIYGIIKKLKPRRPTVGIKRFEGYVAYSFDWTDKVVLECPIYGNATYVINSGEFSWQEIAKNSKWEVRTEYSEQVKVINHSETWLERLEQNLKYGF